MKRLAFALSLVAATAFAAPLAAQGPWYDPNGSGQRTDQGRVDRNGSIYNGGVYNNGGRYDVPTDGRWHRVGTDRQGRTIYMRERYDSYGNVVQEAATRNWLGQYRVIDSRVISYARNNRNGRYDPRGRDNNDRWDRNNGHDNGRYTKEQRKYYEKLQKEREKARRDAEKHRRDAEKHRRDARRH